MKGKLLIALVLCGVFVSNLAYAEKGKGLEWQVISTDGGSYESFARVPGGVILRSEFLGEASLTYFPDPDGSFKPGRVDDISGKFRGKFVRLPTKNGLAYIALDKVVALKDLSGQTEVNLEGGHTVQVGMKVEELFNMLRLFPR